MVSRNCSGKAKLSGGLYAVRSIRRATGVTVAPLPSPARQGRRTSTAAVDIFLTHDPACRWPVVDSLIPVKIALGRADHLWVATAKSPAAGLKMVRSDGSASAASGAVTPPTLVDRLRGQLRSSEELATIGRMTAGIAQELNTPLATLLASLSQVADLAGREESPPSVEEIRAALRDCVTVADRIKDLVGALRGVSHRDHRKAVFFDPARAIRNATKVFAIVNQRRCRVNLTMGALPALHGSPTGVGQVVLSLLQNGLESSLRLQPDGQAHLAVAAVATNSEVQVSVTDDGPGVADQIAPRLFEEFVTSKDDESGRGLGLAISRQIVTGMGGSIEFESAPGKTIFTVRLPFVD
jgi:signal transduction histidine kinase